MTGTHCNKLTLAKTHIQVARMAYSAGEYTAAFKNLNTAERELEEHDLSVDDLTLFDLRKFFGKVRVALGMFGQAEGDFQRALDLARTSSEIPEKSLFSIKRHLADCIRLRSRFDQAESIYRELIGALEDKEPPIGNQLAKSYMGLATVLIDSGKTGEARPFIDKAIQLIEDGPGRKCFWYGRALIVKARLCCAIGQKLEAHELFQHALSIVEPLIGAEHPLARLLERKKSEPVHLIFAELKNIEKQLKDHQLDSEHSISGSLL